MHRSLIFFIHQSAWFFFVKLGNLNRFETKVACMYSCQGLQPYGQLNFLKIENNHNFTKLLCLKNPEFQKKFVMHLKCLATVIQKSNVIILIKQ